MKQPASPRISAAQAYPLEKLFGRVLTPLDRFLQRATASGIVLVVTAIVTIALANSPFGERLEHLWEQSAGIGVRSWALELSMHHWINDGLMALFFLLVGLELKREMLVGELASLKDSMLPIVAAVGGMLVPALVYAAFNYATPGAHGWGIPMATDIAFAIGILVLLASRIPRALIVFLMALAIVDDLGAVLVIALFYTGELNLVAAAGAVVVLVVLVVLNRGGVRHRLPYWLCGAALWYFMLRSGVHATIAGVLLAFTIPVRPARTPEAFDARVSHLMAAFREHARDASTPSDPFSSHDMAVIAAQLEDDARAVQSPLHRTERGLQSWVAFLILPLFAFANAGLDMRRIDLSADLLDPLTVGIALGLLLGKFVGIAGFSYIAVKAGAARLPRGVEWRHLLGAAWLGGIGFTMSLFIAELAFADANQLGLAKLGILSASLASSLIGLAWLVAATSRREGQAR